jgi:hypothetical protein
MKPTIITLGPLNDGGNPVSVTTFEEAFGEYSELRGRGRARRAKRKADRQAKRQQKRMTRITNRGIRKSARQDIRAQQQEARQVRKDTRKSRRVNRKAMGDTEEEMDNQTATETGQDQGQGGGGGSQDQGGGGGFQDQGGGGGFQDQGNGEGESQTTEDSNVQYAEQEADQGSYEEPEQGEAEGDGEADGVMAEDESGFGGELNPGKAVHPKVRECAKKIEWNKELIARLELRKKRLKLLLQNETSVDKISKINIEIGTIDVQMASRAKRIADLENMLSEYSSASGRRNAPRRNAEVRQAKKVARQERAKVSIQKVAQRTPVGRIASKVQARKMARHGGSETPVESDLNPEIEENRIEVPAQGTGNADENNFDGIGTATGRGLIAMDEANDYDTPETRIIELKSNASGSTTDKSKRNKQILIGVGLGVLVIAGLYYANKKGLFKSK